MTSDADEIRQQKLEELQEKAKSKQAEQDAQAAQEQKLEQILRSVLEPAAKERLSNVRLVNQELYYKASQAILYLYQNQKLPQKINETQLKQLLEKLNQKRETTIKRK